MHSIKYLELSGQELKPYFESIAKLRLAVFREYPYLYDGSLEYEKDYLEPLFNSKDSIGILALVDDECIGFSSGLPLNDAHEEFKEPFKNFDFKTNEIFYFGESVLLPKYRQKGIGRQLMIRRINYVEKRKEFKLMVFCTVDRSAEAIKAYRSPKKMWLSVGFTPLCDLSAKFSWKEIGSNEISEHPMQFFGRSSLPWNMELIRSYYNFFNQERWDELLGLLTDDIVHDINQGRAEVGLENFRKFLKRMSESYKELVYDLEYFSCSDSGSIAVRYTVTGSYQKTDGDFPPANNQKYTLCGACFFDFSAGKIKKVCNYYNLNEWLMQIDDHDY